MVAAVAGEDYGFVSLQASIDVVATGRSTHEFIRDAPELPYVTRPVHVFTTRDPGPREGFEFYARSPDEAVSQWDGEGVGRVDLDGGALRIAGATSLRLVESQVFDSGMVNLRYLRA